MPKITIVGAGGFVFPLRLIGDLLSFPALRESELCLMDIDADRLDEVADAAQQVIDHHRLGATVQRTTDRRKALDGADHVIITFQVGGVEAYRHDVEIPRRYGVDQTVGDTIGPGGVFRFLRSVSAYDGIAADLAELNPRANVINYANPMAMATAYLNGLGVSTVGLCHSVQNTSRMLAGAIGVPYEDVHFRVAGINHQAWFTEFRRGREDLYPELRRVLTERHLQRRTTDRLATDDGDHSGADRGVNVYEGGQERVRTQIMDAFGYFHTESSHHASEYLPYFRKNPKMVQQNIPQRWDYYEICAAHDPTDHATNLVEKLKGELTPSMEYGASIVNSIETGTPCIVHGNVPNDGLVTNLPTDSCVEVACVVDHNGVQPTVFGELPPQCAAVNRTNINVQQLAVSAARTRRRDHVYHAVLHDPLTSAVLTIDQINAMTDELFAAHAELLPEGM